MWPFFRPGFLLKSPVTSPLQHRFEVIRNMESLPYYYAMRFLTRRQIYRQSGDRFCACWLCICGEHSVVRHSRVHFALVFWNWTFDALMSQNLPRTGIYFLDGRNHRMHSDFTWYYLGYMISHTIFAFVEKILINDTLVRVYLPFRWRVCIWLCKIGHFHSCCLSPVLNIFLEIPWEIQYIVTHVCIIVIILHVFKMTYKFRNSEQCYLHGKMADNLHSHTKTALIACCPVSVLFLPQLGKKISWFLVY